MKNFLLLLSVLLCYIFITFLDKSFITTDSKIIDFLAKDYPSALVQDYMESQKKWWWVSYAATPIIISIKVLLVAFCLNFLKIVDENASKIKFSEFLFVVLVAEFVFILAGLDKFVTFYWLQTDYTLEDLQTYYPFSLINFKEQISTEKWLAYPLQVSNLYELVYWGVLVWGVRELLDNKISYLRSFGYVALTYGIGLVFWVAVVCFLILNAQY
jgi:hypothetical protein